MDENIFYWNGQAAAMDCGSHLVWMSGATPEAMAAILKQWSPH